MASIFVSGTGSAARTRAWARSITIALALPALIGAAPPGRLDVGVEGLRSERGTVLLCLTRSPETFPSCIGDPDARTRAVPTRSAESIRIDALPSGDYALAIIHDENGNDRLDMFAGIPREGFGFSRNPALRFGPPRFSDARFRVGTNLVREDVRIRYIL